MTNVPSSPARPSALTPSVLRYRSTSSSSVRSPAIASIVERIRSSVAGRNPTRGISSRLASRLVGVERLGVRLALLAPSPLGGSHRGSGRAPRPIRPRARTRRAGCELGGAIEGDPAQDLGVDVVLRLARISHIPAPARSQLLAAVWASSRRSAGSRVELPDPLAVQVERVHQLAVHVELRLSTRRCRPARGGSRAIRAGGAARARRDRARRRSHT